MKIISKTTTTTTTTIMMEQQKCFVITIVNLINNFDNDKYYYYYLIGQNNNNNNGNNNDKYHLHRHLSRTTTTTKTTTVTSIIIIMIIMDNFDSSASSLSSSSSVLVVDNHLFIVIDHRTFNYSIENDERNNCYDFNETDNRYHLFIIIIESKSIRIIVNDNKFKFIDKLPIKLKRLPYSSLFELTPNKIMIMFNNKDNHDDNSDDYSTVNNNNVQQKQLNCSIKNRYNYMNGNNYHYHYYEWIKLRAFYWLSLRFSSSSSLLSLISPSLIFALLLFFTSLFLLIKPMDAKIGPSCRCIIFDDTFGKEYGVFTSPDWPVPYEDNIDCLLYTFIAQPDHIVELIFDEFDVQKNYDSSSTLSSPKTTTTTLNSMNSIDSGCDNGDYVKLFLHLNDNGIDETSEWNPPLLCGKFPDIEQTHFSSNSILIFEFHTDWRTNNNTGFRGTFRFLKKAMFRTDGQLIPGTVCDYNFDHETIQQIFFEKNDYNLSNSTQNNNNNNNDSDHLKSLQSSKQQSIYYNNNNNNKMKNNHNNNNKTTNKYWVGQRGYFFSPQYPSTYPKNIKCSYRFRTNDPDQRIRLLFVEINLQRNDQSCISNNDVINVYDGHDSNANLIHKLCGQIAFLEILSSTNELYVEFISPSNIKQQSSKGFKAEYSFLPLTSLIQPGTLSLLPFTPYSSSSSSTTFTNTKTIFDEIKYPWFNGRWRFWNLIFSYENLTKENSERKSIHSKII